ncbi:MAG: hypothetical protein EXQ92_04490 [Alphaproteobacteria bacterium]|nr:hypothetical protein [Alphaproteobacteria bacterium]
MASDFDDMQRRAMGILSDASHKVMGKVSLVYQTIKNAYETGDLVDYLTASSVFNALPGTKRNQIGHTAFEQARESVGNAGEPVQALAKLPTPALLTPIVEAMPARPAPPRLAEIKQPEPRPGAPAAGGDRTGTPPGAPDACGGAVGAAPIAEAGAGTSAGGREAGRGRVECGRDDAQFAEDAGPTDRHGSDRETGGRTGGAARGGQGDDRKGVGQRARGSTQNRASPRGRAAKPAEISPGRTVSTAQNAAPQRVLSPPVVLN